jgi:hypothetical protein
MKLNIFINQYFSISLKNFLFFYEKFYFFYEKFFFSESLGTLFFFKKKNKKHN